MKKDHTEYIFILGCHKSGTSLLRALLDGHPELNVIPLESHFFKLTGYWIDYPLKRGFFKQLSHKEKKENLIKYIEGINSKKDDELSYADSNTAGEWDLEIFKDIINGNSVLEEQDDKDLYDLYVKGIFKSIGHDKEGSPLKIVEKSVEHIEIVTLIRSFFPSSKFIHIFRNPYANLVALRKKDSKCPFLLNSVLSIYKSFYHAQNNSSLKRYRIIRFEDLVNNIKGSMAQVAEFLEIQFDTCLLKPTSRGVLWGGNSTSDTVFQGISKKPLENWKKEITPFEIDLINTVLDNIINFHGYPRLSVGNRNSIYSFLPQESLSRYFLNRAMLHYLKRLQKSNLFD